MNHLIRRFVIACVLTAGMIDGASAIGSVVGSGAASSCTASAFNTALFKVQASGGGTVTFDCGTEAHVIVLGANSLVSAPVELDGAGSITLSGGNATSLFQVSTTGALTLTNITITEASGAAGAVENFGRLRVRNSNFVRNGGASSAGAIVNHGELDVTDSLLQNNNAYASKSFGGAISLDVGSATIANTRFDRNQAAEGGGAIYAAKGTTITVTKSEFTGNGASCCITGYGEGGTVLSAGTLTMADSVVKGGYGSAGGGVAIRGGIAFITRTVVTGNSAKTGSGVAHLGGALTLLDVTLSGNGFRDPFYYGPRAKTGEPQDGGGFSQTSGIATLTNVTISGNYAPRGGGISRTAGGTATLTNVTISDNLAIFGPALMHSGGATTFINVTVADNDNDAGDAGAMFVNGGSLTLKNVALAHAGKVCNTPIASSTFSFATDATCGFGVAHDNAPLQFGPLENNGGFTLTQVALAGSAGIDKATSAGCPSTDQRGAMRPSGSACDAGAVESISGGTSVLSAVEYYHAEYGHYFVTILAQEMAKLDSGEFRGWVRTGDRFNVYREGAAGRAPVCRFYTEEFYPTSHFYAPRGLGCEGTLQNSDWQFEGDVFYLPLPASNGDCPTSHTPIYRLYNDGQGGAPNHRFTTDPDTRLRMLAAGYIAEGAGIGVGMCSPIGTTSGLAPIVVPSAVRPYP
jgi:predicted outer membrane repeat protein